MAVVARYSLSGLTTQIRFHFGQETAGRSRISDANLYTHINKYVQEIRAKLQKLSGGRQVALPWYFETNQSVSTSSGSSQAWLPENCDIPVLLWDVTYEREIPLLRRPRHSAGVERRRRIAGPTEYAEAAGFALNSATWQRELRLIPDVPTGITPSLKVDQYRVPASMNEGSPTTVYPDIDPRWQDAIIFGVAADMMGTTHPSYDRYRQEEQAVLASALAEAVPV